MSPRPLFEYKLYGIVHPTRADFSIDGLPKAWLINEPANLDGEVSFECKDSKATLTFTTDANLLESQSSDIFATLRNLASEYARFYIDSYCYLRSLNYDLEIIGLKCPELDIDIQFSVQLEDDPTNKVAINTNFEDIVIVAAQSPGIFGVLKDSFADFRRGIKYPHMSGFFFYRAAETIRSNYFDNPSLPLDKRTNTGWTKMHSTLGLTEKDFDNLNKFRKPNAHGIYPIISGEERVKLAQDARKILNAFIQYQKQFLQKNKVSSSPAA